METTLLKKIIQYKIQCEMKKMDIQFLIPIKLINVTKDPVSPTKNPSRRKSWQKSHRTSWRRYWTWLTRMYKMYSRNFNTTKIKNIRRHKKKEMNSDRASTNTKRKQWML
jgi:hypothetical protein